MCDMYICVLERKRGRWVAFGQKSLPEFASTQARKRTKELSREQERVNIGAHTSLVLIFNSRRERLHFLFTFENLCEEDREREKLFFSSFLRHVTSR